MTLRQEKFVDFFIQNGGNGTQAAISAGYSAKTAYSIAEENLRKPEIAAAIAERNRQLEGERIADLSECLSVLTQIMRGEATSERATITAEGLIRYPVRPTIAEMQRAAEVRLKTFGTILENPERRARFEERFSLGFD